MSDFVIQEAKRESIIPSIGFFGRSGGGKTFSALLFARGFVGSTGRIAVIDTENKRASLYADMIPGGYKVLNLDPPFTPERYIAAQEAVIKDGFDIMVIDSGSHLWAGEGGILEAQEEELQRMAGGDYGRREACKMAAWIKPKFRYNQWFQRVLRSPIPTIVCLRGQEKTHMGKDAKGKTVVITDEFSTPIFDSRFIFEMLCNLEVVMADGVPGRAICRKWSHPQILPLLPKADEQISSAHGAALADWCKGKVTVSAPPAGAQLNQLKAQLWELTKDVHLSQKGDSKAKVTAAIARLEEWLLNQGIMSDSEVLGEMDEARLAEVVNAVKEAGL